MARPIRHFAGVQNESLRTAKIRGQQFDDIFNEIHDRLEESYYGERDVDGTFIPGTGWRDGISKPFVIGPHIFDVQSTPEESKELFDTLHGLLWKRYQVAIHKINLSLPRNQQLPREVYDAGKRDENGNVLEWKSDTAQVALDAAKSDVTRPIDFTDLIN